MKQYEEKTNDNHSLFADDRGAGTSGDGGHGNRQYAKNPFFHVPDLNGGQLSLGGSIRHMYVFQMSGQDIVFADGHPLLTKAHVYKPLEKE